MTSSFSLHQNLVWLLSRVCGLKVKWLAFFLLHSVVALTSLETRGEASSSRIRSTGEFIRTSTMTSTAPSSVPNVSSSAYGGSPLLTAVTCNLCGGESAVVSCSDCDSLHFCSSCDDMYHRHPKRKFHLRKSVTANIVSNNRSYMHRVYLYTCATRFASCICLTTLQREPR